MSDVKIDKGIPMPESKNSSKYPWGELEIGDSFLAVGAKTISSLTNSKRGAALRYGMEYITRTTPEGIRVWRVK